MKRQRTDGTCVKVKEKEMRKAATRRRVFGKKYQRFGLEVARLVVSCRRAVCSSCVILTDY